MLVIGLSFQHNMEPEPNPTSGVGFGSSSPKPDPTLLGHRETRDRYMLCHQKWHYRQVPLLGVGLGLLGLGQVSSQILTPETR
jgi:hypothetical protein